MKRKYIIIIISILVIILLIELGLKFVYPTVRGTYSLTGDYVPSIKTVLKETKYADFKWSYKDKILFEQYTYKNIKNVQEDLKKYTNYLIQMEEFKVLRTYDLLDDTNTTIYLGKVSHVNSKYIILLTIEYDDSSYKISLEKKQGEIFE